MVKVKIDGDIFFAEEGEKLSDILISNKKSVAHPCGGRGMCKKCTVFVDGKSELSCQYKVTRDIEVTLPDESEIISVTGTEETGKLTESMCFCLDIGTTTLSLSLVSLDDRKTIKNITRTNPQCAFGADVITRIDYCRKNGVSQLQKVLLDEINKITDCFEVSFIDEMYVSGNTTMLHILFGIDPSPLGVAPYSPVFLGMKEENFPEIRKVGKIISLPCISAFIGADLVAGLNFTPFPQKGKYNLLIDLGTNAEIILYSKDKFICTSASAGPCFEGGNISCGMCATEGAIYAYGKGVIKTIGNKTPKGICGTGLVDIIAELLSQNVIDRTGFMECEEDEIAGNVSITQEDVRQYQLAKSAVYSALITLIKNRDISFDDIEKVFISGGFSAKLNISNAIKTGLIPDEFKEICMPIHNSSLLGTVKYAVEKNDLSVFTKNAEYVDMSSDNYFSDLFIENMMF